MSRPLPALDPAPATMHAPRPLPRPLPRPRAGVVFQRVPGGAVLLSTADELYFGLNAVGADVWELLPPVRFALDELCAEILARYPDAPAGAVHDDVGELLDALRAAALVVDGPGT